MRALTAVLCGTIAATLCAGTLSSQSQRVIRHHAPTDRAIDWPVEAQQAEYQTMDTQKLQTVRVVEGGRVSINLRRIVGAETALIHEDRGDVWFVREGSGTLVTGGELVDPRRSASGVDLSGSAIRGGIERTIKAGDVVFIPPGIPHGIKESKNITWVNIHYAQKAGVWPHYKTGGSTRIIRDFARIDRAIDWSTEAQQQEDRWMDARKVTGVRVVEGGVISINNRREFGRPTFNLHKDEGDIWIAREGSATLVTGGEIVGEGESRTIRGGVERQIKAGDIVYVPPRVVHGIKDHKMFSWVNIHFEGD